MLFMIAGYLKPGSEDQMLALHNEFNEHLMQPFRNVPIAGALRNRDGQRIGYMAFVEGDSFADAERYLAESPFYQEHLYDRVEVAEYAIEAGSLG